MTVLFASLAVCVAFGSPDSDADEQSGYITVEGVAGAKNRYDSFEALYTDLKAKMGTALGGGDAIYREGPVNSWESEKFTDFFTDNVNKGVSGKENDYDAKITYTIHGTVVYDETELYGVNDNNPNHSYLLSLGRAASRFNENLHLSHFEIVGADENAKLVLNSKFELPYQWWSNGKNSGDTHWTYLTLKNIKVVKGNVSTFSVGQAFSCGIGVTLKNVEVSGLNCYVYMNNSYSFTAEDCSFDGKGIDSSGMHFQGSTGKDKSATITIEDCSFNGYAYAINVDQDSAEATIEGCTFKTTSSVRPCIQIAGCSKMTVSGNTFYVVGNAFSFHSVLKDSENLVESISITKNTLIDATTNNGKAYFAYTAKSGSNEDGDEAISNDVYKKVSVTENKIAETIDLINGVNKYGKVSTTNTNIVVSEDQVIHQSSSGTVVIETKGVKTSSQSQGNVSVITTTIAAETEDIDQAVKEAVAQSSLAGSVTSGDTSAEIVIQTNTVNVALTKTSIVALKDSGASLSVKNSSGTVSLDTGVLNTLSVASTSIKIELTSAPTLTPAQTAKIGSNSVIDVSAYMDDAKISSLGGSATIQVPYESDGTARVTYIAEDGSTQDVPCTYSNGVVTFSTNHFSAYMLSSTPSFIPVPDNRGDDFPGYIPQPDADTGSGKDSQTTEVAIIAGAIAVVLVAIVALVHKSR